MGVFLCCGCVPKEITKVNVLATADLHGEIPYELKSYIKKEKEESNVAAVVDSGAFYDRPPYGQMKDFFQKRDRYLKYDVKESIDVPIISDMKNVGYDAVVLGDHEFMSNNKYYLDDMISQFENKNISVLSANTYNNDGSNYIKRYIIKDVNTSKGKIKLGILGLTLNEIGEPKKIDKDGVIVDSEYRKLKDQIQYKDVFYMNDLVADAEKWVHVMKREKPDIILAVVHAGDEDSNSDKQTGNIVKELATKVDGIDAIVGGHTHTIIVQNEYRNPSGKKVIVTQPGSYGECISKISFNMAWDEKNKSWSYEGAKAEITQFDQIKIIKQNVNLFFDKMFTINNEDSISLSKQLPFDWDEIYVFKYGATREQIYEKVGYKWQEIDKMNAQNELNMVFMNKNKVVSYIHGPLNEMGIEFKFDEKLFENNLMIIDAGKNDEFTVELRDDFGMKLEQKEISSKEVEK